MISLKNYLFFLIISIGTILLLAGCTQANTRASTAVSTMSPTTLLPTETYTATLEAATPTVENTSTSTTTPSPEPTFTQTLVPTLGFEDSALSAWCLPENTSWDALQLPLNPPDNARIGVYNEGVLQVDNLPVGACVIVYHLNMAAPSDLILEVFDKNVASPWLSIDLKPVEDDSKSVYAQLTHTYIVAPPYWNISYQFSVKDSSGVELRRDQVNLNRWTPKPCWNGRLPNVFTLMCPLKQDLHPWDAGYGTPVPTNEPEPEED